jgi:RimJ/RimL family protein N-acetyltransferase
MKPPRVNEHGQPIGAALPDWRAPPVPPRAVLSGRHCRLEPLDADLHGFDLFAGCKADPTGASWTYMSVGPFTDYEGFEDHLARIAVDERYVSYAIVEVVSGRALGLCHYMRMAPKDGCIEIGGIWYSPALQRTRAATEAMYLLMRNVFALGYRRYEWKCDALNAASRAAALRLGFEFEGIFRQAIVYKSRSRDTAWFAVIDQDWPALERAYLLWLDPANFDADGHQRRKLESLRTA